MNKTSITCSKCAGKVFIDLTFVDNVALEAFCIKCGKRDFIGKSHPMYELLSESVGFLSLKDPSRRA